MIGKIGGQRMWLWPAVDDEGEVLDMLVHTRSNTKAACQPLRRRTTNTGVRPETVTTDGAASYR